MAVRYIEFFLLHCVYCTSKQILVLNICGNTCQIPTFCNGLVLIIKNDGSRNDDYDEDDLEAPLLGSGNMGELPTFVATNSMQPSAGAPYNHSHGEFIDAIVDTYDDTSLGLGFQGPIRRRNR